MIFEKINSAGIAHNSYFIGSGKESAVIDPRRDISIYLDEAGKHNLKIKYIFETHRNEDYTIGSLELASLAGSEIYHGSKLDFNYGNSVYEGDKFNLGSLELEILETPGHTDESISITVKDLSVSDDVYLIFTGDALFAGEVGRIDLYGDNQKIRMADNLYDTIFNKILPLGDNVLVYPAHGAGSVCGANIREHEFTSIGYEKKTNHLLQLEKEKFISEKNAEIMDIPPYFKKMEIYNKNGAPILSNLPYLKPLSMEEIKKHSDNRWQIVDIRPPESFAGGHIPNSLSIFKDILPVYGGWMLNYDDPIVIIDENGDQSVLDEIIRYLIRIGYDNIDSYLARGFDAWFKGAGEIKTVNIWTVHELKENIDDDSIFLLDVRKNVDWPKMHIEGAYHIFVGELKERLSELPRDKSIVIYCDVGYKTSLAVSVLEKHGFNNLTNVLGGITAWVKAGYSY
jgi:hydroxyacylglutathione hydrolase